MPKIPTENPITFKVLPKPWSVPNESNNAAFLIKDNWDDNGYFETLFDLVVFDKAGVRHDLGSVKIGQFKLKRATSIVKPREGYRKPPVPHNFNELDETFFSVGQDDSYYVTLMKLNENLRKQILKGLRDLVADQKLWRRARKEDVVTRSLLRSLKPKTVEGQFRRILLGQARLTPYKLTYTAEPQTSEGEPPLSLSFSIEPDSNPPTNIHVLIGRNGVGKSHMLHSMTKALVAKPSVSRRCGKFSSGSPDEESAPIANLVSVSFSAFDNFELVPEKSERANGILYSYIGLRRFSDGGEERETPKSFEFLSAEFAKSVKLCIKGPRARRWRRAIETLEADSLFREADVKALIEHDGGGRGFELAATRLFKALSSGHKLVLLTITRLVETVEEQTLVLLDEPESHLHPPLLASFVRALSDLMIDRNGVAIIATHSPVVLQEVPNTCVWVLQRSGNEAKAERPESETFGENVGVLTREVFGLEVTQSGFHKLLSEAVDREGSFETAVEHFHNELGGEARAILRALFLTKNLNDRQ